MVLAQGEGLQVDCPTSSPHHFLSDTLQQFLRQTSSLPLLLQVSSFPFLPLSLLSCCVLGHVSHCECCVNAGVVVGQVTRVQSKLFLTFIVLFSSSLTLAQWYITISCATHLLQCVSSYHSLSVIIRHVLCRFLNLILFISHLTVRLLCKGDVSFCGLSYQRSPLTAVITHTTLHWILQVIVLPTAAVVHVSNTSSNLYTLTLL